MQNENKVEAKIKQLILGTTNLHQLQHLDVQEEEKVLGLDCHKAHLGHYHLHEDSVHGAVTFHDQLINIKIYLC